MSRHHGRWKVSSCPCTYRCLRIDLLPDTRAMTWKEFRLRQILHRASMRPLGLNKGKSIMPLPWRPWHSRWGGAPGAGAVRRRHSRALGPTSLCQHPGKRPSSSSWGQWSAKGNGCPSPKGGLSPDAEPFGHPRTACSDSLRLLWRAITAMGFNHWDDFISKKQRKLIFLFCSSSSCTSQTLILLPLPDYICFLLWMWMFDFGKFCSSLFTFISLPFKWSVMEVHISPFCLAMTVQFVMSHNHDNSLIQSISATYSN